MRRLYQVASLGFLALAVFVMFEGRRLSYYTDIGPGPGFFPFWVGGFLGVLAVIWLGAVSFRPVEPMPGDFIPSRDRARQVIAVLASLVVFTAVVKPFGFRLTMLAFLLVLIGGLGRVRLVWTVIIALAGSWGVYYVFHQLQVSLPVASIDFLNGLGL